MFTGIVRELGTVGRLTRTKAGRRLVMKSKLNGLRSGDSVAVNGVCLTVVPGDELAFDVIPETLSRSNLGQLKKGSRVNLEPALRAGEPIGGHFVQGEEFSACGRRLWVGVLRHPSGLPLVFVGAETRWGRVVRRRVVAWIRAR